MSKKSGMSTAALVLGIIGICTSFIPIINNLSLILGGLAIVFGLIMFCKKTNKTKSLVSIILGILSIVIALSVQKGVSDALDEVSDELDTMTGENTNKVLENVDVEIGTFEVEVDEYGLVDSKLVVKITNTSGETKSFDFEIEALDSEGNRLGIDYIYANDLANGQSQSFELFTLISSDEVESYKNATFKVIEASMY